MTAVVELRIGSMSHGVSPLLCEVPWLLIPEPFPAWSAWLHPFSPVKGFLVTTSLSLSIFTKCVGTSCLFSSSFSFSSSCPFQLFCIVSVTSWDSRNVYVPSTHLTGHCSLRSYYNTLQLLNGMTSTCLGMYIRQHTRLSTKATCMLVCTGRHCFHLKW